MTDLTGKEIKRLLVEKSMSVQNTDYSKLSAKQLKSKYKYLKKKLHKNNKWQLEEFKTYCTHIKEIDIDVLTDLMFFELEYSSRIKSLQSFGSFVKNLLKFYKQESKEILEKHKSSIKKRKKGSSYFKIELKNKENIGDLLIATKKLKQLINCNNEEIIELIHKHIDTGYSKQTLLKYYYSYNSEKPQ